MAEYRFVGVHLETLDDGQAVAPGDVIDLKAEQVKQPRTKELIDGELLIPMAGSKKQTTDKEGGK